MSIDQAHLDALATVLQTVTAPGPRRKLKECLVVLTNLHTQAQSERAYTALTEQGGEQPLEERDLDIVHCLLAKAIEHNGLVPVLGAVDMARGVGVVTALLERARAGALSAEQDELLLWLFDQAQDSGDANHRRQVRRLEESVRGGLGIPQRLAGGGFHNQPLS